MQQQKMKEKETKECIEAADEKWKGNRIVFKRMKRYFFFLPCRCQRVGRSLSPAALAVQLPH